MRSSSAARAILSLLLIPALLNAQNAPHDKAYWRAIAKNDYAVPANESAGALAREVSQLLGSPDPELRDDLAYSILVRWIYRLKVLQTPDLLALTDQWRDNLKIGIGESGTNSVLKRSFSALCLSLIANREAKQPFLGEQRYHQLIAEAVNYLQAERDLRGYDGTLGWIHANAHTADLLQALAGSTMLTKEEENNILAALAARLSTASQVYTQGEQDRMAAALLAVIRRPSFDSTSFATWLQRVEEEDKKVWATPLTPESLSRFQNHTYFLQALTVRLALEPESASITEYRTHVLAILRTRLD
jgi:uncharacterized membrane protein